MGLIASMDIIELILNALLNVLSIYTNFRIINFFLEKRKINRCIAFLIYFITWFFNWGIHFFLNNVYLTSITLFGLLLFATIMLYDGSFIRKIVAVFSNIALGIVVDDIVWRLFSYFNLIERIELFANLITSLILILLILLAEHFFDVNKNKYITKESYINILLVLFGNILLIYILASAVEIERVEVLLMLIIICSIDISTFWLHNKVNEVYREKIEKQVMQEQILMYKKQFDIIRQSQARVDSLRHDMKKHMFLIGSYLQQENYDAAIRYIQSTQSYINVSNQYVYTGNQELDAILNYSLEKANIMQCEIETRVTVPNSVFINEFDLNVLLGNLLDNSIEALKNVKERYLYIGISFRNNMLLIRVWNSFDGVLNKKGRNYISRKKEKEQHGIGLKNVHEIVRKYDGEINVHIEKNVFKVDIILYL